MKIEYRKLEDLVPYARNPRDNRNAIDKVAASIQAFGFLVPIIIDKNNVIIAGHTRFLAARKIGMKEVPTIKAYDLSEDQVKAFRLADNRVAEISVWDIPLLGEMLDDIGDEIDMSQFGFEPIPVPDIYDMKDTGKEFDANDFEDEAFEYECPECGFHFSES